jgi:hypothetical protein
MTSASRAPFGATPTDPSEAGSEKAVVIGTPEFWEQMEGQPRYTAWHFWQRLLGRKPPHVSRWAWTLHGGPSHKTRKRLRENVFTARTS